MNVFDHILAAEWITRLGWTLLHSLWEIALVTAVLASVLALLRRRSASLRYLTACAGLAVMAILPIVTFAMLSNSQAPKVSAAVSTNESTPTEDATTSLQNSAMTGGNRPADMTVVALESPGKQPVVDSTSATVAAPIAPASAVEVRPITKEPETPLSQRVAAVISPWTPWCVVAWFVGVFAMSVWNLGGWIAAQRLKRLGTQPVTDHRSQRLAMLAERSGIKRSVTIMKSLIVEVPVVVGWLRPVILLPVSVLTGLTPAELDSILAHELAHIRRHDYLVNLLQTVVETLLFYHPGVWWTSRQIRAEREHCCDDAAVFVCGNKIDYAAALAAVEAGRRTPNMAMAARKCDGSTLGRIRRVLGIGGSGPRRLCSTVAGGLVTSAMIVALVACFVVAEEPAAEHADWAKAAAKVFPDWKVVESGRFGKADIGVAEASRLLLAKGRWEYVGTVSQQQSDIAAPRDIDYANDPNYRRIFSRVDIVTFDEKADLPKDVIEKLPWTEWEDTDGYFVKTVDLGTGLGRRWFVRTTLFWQDRLRTELKLTGGDDPVELLAEGLLVEDEGSCTANSVEHLLAPYGDEAVAYLKQQIEKPYSPEELARLVRPLAHIRTKAADDLLNALYADPRTEDAAAYALISGKPRKACKAIYFDLLKKRRRIRYVGEACVAFDWQEAGPMLHDIYLAAEHRVEREISFIAWRNLGGRPIPKELIQARYDISYHAGNPQKADVVDMARKTILQSPDKEAALFIATILTESPGFKVPGERVEAMQRIGKELVRKLAEVSAALKARRNDLLAAADATIRRDLIRLAEKYPYLSKAKAWRSVTAKSDPGKIGLCIFHTSKGKAAQPTPIRKGEEFSILVVLEGSRREESQLATWPIFRNLGLVGQISTRADDPKLSAELKQLVADALKPLADLDSGTPTTKAMQSTWSKPVDGLRWRISLPSDRVEVGKPIEVDMEFENVSDKPIRIFKTPTVTYNLYPMLYTADGNRDMYPIEHYVEWKVPPGDAVLIEPGKTHRTKWSKMSTKQPGPAKIIISYSSPKNTNPDVKPFWSGRLDRQQCEFTVVLPDGSVPETQPVASPAAPADLEKAWNQLGTKNQALAYKAVASLCAAGDKAVQLADREIELNDVGPGPFPETVEGWRTARAIRMLELIGSDAAKDMLTRITTDGRGQWPEVFAQEALKRLANQPSGPTIEKFGVNRGLPIYDGFLFFDGKYSPAPYVVERWGVDVYINGVLVERGHDDVLGIAVIDERKTRQENRLRNGSVIFDRTRGGEMSSGKERGLAMIEAMLAQANGSEAPTGDDPFAPNPRQPKEAMKKEAFRAMLRPFIKDFKASPQLIQRLKQLGRDVQVTADDGGWSETTNGLTGRLRVAKATIEPSEQFQLKLELSNVNRGGGPSLAVPSGNPSLFEARVTDADGKPVKPTSGRAEIFSMTKWKVIRPFPDEMLTIPLTIDNAKGYHLDTTTSIWKLPPGTYKISGTFSSPERIAYTGNGEPWIGKLELPPVTVHIAANDIGPPNERAKKQAVWGKPVDGVQCRIAPDKKSWAAREIPTCKLFVRSAGFVDLWLSRKALSQNLIELDGVWYRKEAWGIAGATHQRSSYWAKHPGEMRITLDDQWRRVGDEQAGDPLKLTPGTHKLRFRWVGVYPQKDDPEKKDESRPCSLMSNAVEFEILPPGAEAEETSSKAVEIEPTLAKHRAELKAAAARLAKKAAELEKMRAETFQTEAEAAKGGSEKPAAMPAKTTVRGTVVDDETGKPVTEFIMQGGKFDPADPAKVTWGYSETLGSWKDGKFSATVRWPEGWIERIVAPGYLPQPVLSKPPSPGQDSIKVVIRLKWGDTIRGRVRDYNGEPVANAGVYLAGRGVINLAEDPWDKIQSPTVRTDANGRFDINGRGEDSKAIFVTSPSLYVWQADVPGPLAFPVIKLPEPAKLHIHYDIEDGPPTAQVRIQLRTWDMPKWKGLIDVVRWVEVKPGEDGVVVDNLPPGVYDISRIKHARAGSSGRDMMLDRELKLTLVSGKTTVYDFVRKSGTPITGEVVGLPEKGVDGVFLHVSDQQASGDPRNRDDWKLRTFDGLALPGNGPFETERIPPGKYKVIAQAYRTETPDEMVRSGWRLPKWIGTAEVEIPEDGDPPKVRLVMHGASSASADKNAKAKAVAAEARAAHAEAEAAKAKAMLRDVAKGDMSSITRRWMSLPSYEELQEPPAMVRVPSGSERVKAHDAQGKAERLRTAYESAYRPGPIPAEGRADFEKAETAFRDLLALLEDTDSEADAVVRFAGLYQYVGEKAKPMELIESFARKRAAQKVKRDRMVAAIGPELKALIELMMAHWTDKVSKEQIKATAAKLSGPKEQAVDLIIEHFNSTGNSAFQHRAIVALEAIGGPEATEALLTLALRHGSPGYPRTFAEKSARAYVALVKEKNDLYRLLASDDEGVLWHAMSALRGRSVDEVSLQTVAELLQSEKISSRMIAVNVLADDPTPDHAEEKVQLTLDSIKTARQIENPDRLTYHGYLTEVEALYYAYLGGLTKMQGIGEALEKPEAETTGATRICVAVARGERGDQKARAAVLKVLTDPEAGILRARATLALEQIGRVEDLAVLRKVAQSDPLSRERGHRGPPGEDQNFFPVREAAQRTIRVIEERGSGEKD